MRRISPTDGKQAQAEFICKLENIQNAIEYTGLEVVSSLNITGIPTEPELKNPAIVDELIEIKEIVDYKTMPIDIPVFNATYIETTNSKKTGIFTIIGEFLTEFTLETRFEFDLVLVTGEKVKCTLPKISGKGEI